MFPSHLSITFTFHMHSNPTSHPTFHPIIYQTFIDVYFTRRSYPAQIHRMCLKRTRLQNTSGGVPVSCASDPFCRRSSFKLGNVYFKCLVSRLFWRCRHWYLALLVVFILHSHSHIACNTFHLHDGKIGDQMALGMDGKPSRPFGILLRLYWRMGSDFRR